MGERVYLDDATVEQLRAELARREGYTPFAVTPTEAERGVLVDRRDGRRERVWPVEPPDAVELAPGDRVVGVRDWHAALIAAGLHRFGEGWARPGPRVRVIGRCTPEVSDPWWWQAEESATRAEIVAGPRYDTEEAAARAWLAARESERAV